MVKQFEVWFKLDGWAPNCRPVLYDTFHICTSGNFWTPYISTLMVRNDSFLAKHRPASPYERHTSKMHWILQKMTKSILFTPVIWWRERIEITFQQRVYRDFKSKVFEHPCLIATNGKLKCFSFTQATDSKPIWIISIYMMWLIKTISYST